MLPVVERELRMAARRPSTFRFRLWVTIGTSAIAAIVLLIVGASRGAGAIGDRIFLGLSWLALLYCMFDGARTAADCLSEEKREGTLGLLFLTDLRGYDIVLGKLAAVSALSFQGLLAFVPVLSVTLLLGGVTFGEFWRVAALLANTLFLSIAVGVFISSRSWESHRAQIATLAVMGGAALAYAPLEALSNVWNNPAALTVLKSLSPAHPIILMPDAVYATRAREFWAAIGTGQGIAWILLGWVSWTLSRCWRDAPREGAEADRQAQAAEGQSKYRKRVALRDGNPMEWLVFRRLGNRRTAWLFAGVCAFFAFISLAAAAFSPAGGGVVMFGVPLLDLAFKVWLASEATYAFAQARRAGALELIWTTPFPADQILAGYRAGLKRIFFWPVIAALALKLLALSQALASQSMGNGLIATFFGMLSLGTFVLDLLAISWIGIWAALSLRKPNHAFMVTLLIGVVAPIVVFCVPNVLFDIVVIVWAGFEVKTKFRTLIMKDFDARGGARGTGAVPPLLAR